MKLEIATDEEAVARRAAELIATMAREVVQTRGRFTFAVSGGRTPWKMLRFLADADVPWSGVELFQVDERIAPAGDRDRNLTHLEESLLSRVALPPGNVHPMPVERDDFGKGAWLYEAELHTLAGVPPVLDLVHLGLGPDGHTASLVPGDPVLEVMNKEVAVTGVYQGRRRMTLTYPPLNRARQVLWLVAGAEKAEMLRRLRDGDPTIPAGRVAQERALVVADRAAAGSANAP